MPPVVEPSGISVIIPLYNKAATIGRAIESVLSQDHPNELIVVDDGSTDGSCAVISRYGERVRLLTQANAGPAAARNHGVAESRYPVLAFLDGDDEFLPGALSAHAACRQRWNDARLTLGSFRKTQDGMVDRTERLGDRLGVEAEADCIHYTHCHAGLVIDVPSCAIAIDRQLFDELGGFDEQLRCWEITDLLWRAQCAAGATGVINTHTSIVHQHTDNSQFGNLFRDVRYQQRYAHKLLDGLHLLPADMHLALLKPLRNFLHHAWQAGDIAGFRRLARRLCPYLLGEESPRKYCMASHLPTPLLTLIRRLQRLD